MEDRSELNMSRLEGLLYFCMGLGFNSSYLPTEPGICAVSKKQITKKKLKDFEDSIFSNYRYSVDVKQVSPRAIIVKICPQSHGDSTFY